MIRRSSLPHSRLPVLAGLALASLASCGDSPPGGPAASEVLVTYADVLHAGYDDAVADAIALRAALEPLFSGTPTDAELEAARAAWTASRRHYMQTEYARFVDGPIDGPEFGELEIRINAWPLDEATIDYVRADAGSAPMRVGLINTPAEGEITRELLTERNMAPAEQNVTIGYHAIEFLLWGQDFRADGPGDRSVDDFVVGTGENADRRRAYLDVVSQMLIDDLTAVRDEWAPGVADNHRATFLAMPEEEALSRVLTAWGRFTVGELSGQRINEAIVTRDQEDEHSCFSDTTLLDHEDDVASLSNVYLGRYTRRDGSVVEGPSLSQMIEARDPELDARTREHLDAALGGVRALPLTAGCAEASLEGACPFDQLIRNDAGRSAIMQVVREVRTIGTDISEMAPLLGVTIDITEE